MVICNTHNFIFLPVPRCASTSLSEFFVSNFCTADNDQWMPIRQDMEQRNVNDTIIEKYKVDFEYHHLTLQELVDNELVTEEKAVSMTKIVVLREPLARQLSLYLLLTNQNRQNQRAPKIFRREFKRGYHLTDYNNKKKQMDFPKLNGVVASNTLFWNFNNLAAELNTFCADKGPIEHSLNMWNNENLTGDIYTVDEYYDESTRQAVLTYYAEDVEAYANV